MKTRFYLLLWALYTAQSGLACIDFGVVVKSGGRFDSLGVKTTGRTISFQGEDGTSYSFDYKVNSYKGNKMKGSWCFTIRKEGTLRNGCTDEAQAMNSLKAAGFLVEGAAMPEIAVRNKEGAITSIVRLQDEPNTLAGTKVKGSFLFLVKASSEGSAIRYSNTRLRFTYTPVLLPPSVETNNLDKLEAELRHAGLGGFDSLEKVRDYSITHNIYADLVEDPTWQEINSGFADTFKIRGTLRHEKKEFPFAPVPRALATTGTGEVDISKGHFRGEKGAGGCTTSVKKVGDVNETKNTGVHAEAGKGAR